MTQNSKYIELEDLIFKGFLPLKIKIANINFVFKTLNDLEYNTCRLMSGLESDSFYTANFYLNYLYLSLYMINGANILPKREALYPYIFNSLKEYPSALIFKLFSELDLLLKHTKEVSKFIEGYSFEHVSRYNWLHKKTTLLNNPSLTGILGTEKLGLNDFQKYWISLNIREDQKETFEDKYQLTKFLASFTDSKSVKKLDAMDKAKKEEEKERREAIKARGTSDEVFYREDPTATAEGIVQELEKQIKGVDKDYHDKAIEEHEKRMRYNMLKQTEELKKLQEQKRKTFVEMEEARPISPQEMQERINKMRSRDRVSFNTDIDPEVSSKLLQMTNVNDEELLDEIKKENELKNIDITPETDKKLAFKVSSEKEIPNFPNLRSK